MKKPEASLGFGLWFGVALLLARNLCPGREPGKEVHVIEVGIPHCPERYPCAPITANGPGTQPPQQSFP